MPNGQPEQLANLKPFKKGDKRINRLGRPRSFDALRKLAQKIAASDLPPNEKGEALTRVEAMLTVMSSSRNPADRKTFLEYAFGKPKDEINVQQTGVTKVEIEYVNSQNTTPSVTPRAGADQEPAEKV